MGVAHGLTRIRAATAALSTHGGRPAAAAALVLYLALALGVTWPWLIHPASTTFGITSGDLGSHIGTPAEWARDGQVPWLPGHLADVNAPEGLANQWALNLAAAPSLTLLTALTAAVGAVPASGVWAVISFALSAWAMFLLARRLTGRADAALLAGLAFGFWPYSYATATQPLGDGWVLVILVWRMIELLERPTLRNGVLAGAGALLAMWWVQYWFAIAGVLWLSLAVAGLVVARRRGRLREALRAQLVAAAPVVVLGVVLLAAGLATGFSDVPDRPVGDLSTYSARPAMYVVPGPWQPLVGGGTGPWLARHFDGVTGAAYNPIYVGLTTIALALIGALALARARRRAALAACAAAGLVAFVMSMPPRLSAGPVSVPTPADLVGQVTTAFRTSARFGHVVMLALCLLAAVGAARCLRGRRPAAAAALTLVAGAAIFIDLWGRDPTIGAPTRVDVPPTVRTLERLPDGVVAVYPLLPAPSERSSRIYQASFHGKPLFNGYRQGTSSETAKLGLAPLSRPWVPSELARLGVRYVLVEGSGDGADAQLPSGGRPEPGLRRVDEDDYATLYEVTARPAADLALADSGFSFVDGAGGDLGRYMTSASGRLRVRSTCDRCTRTLHLVAAAVGAPRTVTARDASGAVLRRVRLGGTPTPIAIPVRLTRGTATVSLTADPGPAPVAGDYRQAALRVSARLRVGPGAPPPAR